MVAQKVGETGVQRISAVVVKAPQVDYWALKAGDGARLDGRRLQNRKTRRGMRLIYAS